MSKKNWKTPENMSSISCGALSAPNSIYYENYRDSKIECLENFLDVNLTLLNRIIWFIWLSLNYNYDLIYSIKKFKVTFKHISKCVWEITKLLLKSDNI